MDPAPGSRFVLGGTTIGGLAISPDGKMLAYTASVNKKTGLWVRPLEGGTARLLPGTENAGQPFWSPNSKSIALVGLRTSLRRVDPAGGMPTTICNPVLLLRA
jgi:Tol biopolymer transport system component